MGLVKIAQGSPEKYNSLEDKDNETLYFLDDGTLYRGEIQYGTSTQKIKSIVDESAKELETSFNVEVGKISSKVSEVTTYLEGDLNVVKEQYSTIEQTARAISTEVADLTTKTKEDYLEINNKVSNIEQTASSIETNVGELNQLIYTDENGDTQIAYKKDGSTVTQSVSGISQQISSIEAVAEEAQAAVDKINNISYPISVIITSSNGIYFRGGAVSTVLTARVFRDGEELDKDGNDSSISYEWHKDESDDVFAITKSIGINADQVNYKEVFTCNVEVN